MPAASTKRGIIQYDGTDPVVLDTLLNAVGTTVEAALDQIDWYRVGTIAQRNALPSTVRRTGMKWEDSATGTVSRWSGSAWVDSPLLPDTGWVDLSSYITSGASGTISGRNKGGIISIVGSLSGLSIPNNDNAIVATGIPTNLCPDRRTDGTARYNNYSIGLAFDPAGSLRIYNRSSLTATNAAISVTCLAS